MSYDRFKHLNKMRTKFFWSFNQSLLSILLAWGLSACISFPQIFIFKMGEIKGDCKVRTCLADWPSKDLEIIYVFYHVVLQYILPLVLMTFFFTQIYYNVQKTKANMRKNQDFLLKSQSRNNRYRRSYSESRIKTFKLTFTIVLTFFLCGLPFYSATIVNVLFREQMIDYRKLYGINISNLNNSSLISIFLVI